LRLAFELWPDDVGAIRGLASIPRRIASFDPPNADALLSESEALLKSALQIRPGDPNTVPDMGDVIRLQASSSRVASQKFELFIKARESYKDALKTLPDHYGALFGAGLTIMELTNYLKAAAIPSKERRSTSRRPTKPAPLN
jgi:hypothetical protein